MTAEGTTGADGALRGTVLITGASSGIGRTTTMHLDRLGFRVLAGIRKTEDGESLQREGSERVIPIMIDITIANSIAEAARHVEEIAPLGLDGLVNNAGIALTGPLEYLDVDRIRNQFEVNFFGHLAVTQAMLPALRQRTGRIVNMSSMAGWLGVPFYGPYTSSKHALRAASDALRLELAPWGLHVSIIEPGSIDTPIWEKGYDLAEQTIEAMPEAGRARYAEVIRAGLGSIENQGSRGIDPGHVAEAVATALMARRPKARYVVGRDARFAILGKRLLPDRLVDAIVRRQMKLPKFEAYRRG